MSGFVFFDTETTGLRPGWDQIVHFAAIHTDAELNELDRCELRSRLSPYVVPHPRAILANGLAIDTLIDHALPSHLQMMTSVAQRLADWSPAVFVGYNSIRFDEEMLRHNFFQTLHDPYLTSRPGSGRADALALAHSAACVGPSCLIVPTATDGRPTFRLAEVAQANGLAHAKAHDAFSDATVTLELCRLIRTRAEDLWSRFVRFSSKAHVAQFVDGDEGFVLTEFFGERAFHRPVIVIGPVPKNQNGRFCLDLTIAPEDWRGMSDEAMQSELCRPGTPLRRLAVNAAPALTELWAAPEDHLGAVDLAEAERRAAVLRADPDLCARIIHIYTSGWTDRPALPYPECQLYQGGFSSDPDQDRRRAFHDASRAERLRLVQSFEDERLAEFGARLIHTEHRAALSPEVQRSRDLKLASRLLDAEPDGPLTLPDALAILETVQQEGPTDQEGILGGFGDWLRGRIERVQAFKQEFIVDERRV